MLRKILNLGRSTYAITLPVSWVKHHNLTKGDSLNLEIIDNHISIENILRDSLVSIDYKSESFYEQFSFFELLGYERINIENAVSEFVLSDEFPFKKEENSKDNMVLVKKKKLTISKINIISLIKMCSLLVFLKRNKENDVKELYLRIKSKIKVVESNIINMSSVERIKNKVERALTLRIFFFLKYFIKNFYTIIDENFESYCSIRLFLDTFNAMIEFYDNRKTLSELFTNLKENIVYGKKYLLNVKVQMSKKIKEFLITQLNSLSLIIS